MNRKKSAWVALVLALSLALSACGGAKSPDPGQNPSGGQTAKKSLTIGMWSAPSTLNPLTYTTTYEQTIISLIYPRLLVMDQDLNFVGQLADRWEPNETYDKFTFHIHNDAKWSDGTPITSEDVLYTIGAIAHPKTPTTRRSMIDTIVGLDDNGVDQNADFVIEGFNIVDDKTFEISTKTPVNPDTFFEKLGANVYIQPKKVLSTVTDWLNVDKQPWALKPEITGGAYNFVKYQTGSYVELAPNKDYWLGAPALDSLFVKVVAQGSFAAAIEAGEIDISGGAGVGEVPITDWEKVSKLPNVVPATYTAPSYQYLDINVLRPEFQDVRVRQALAYAINRELIVSRLLDGEGEVLNTPINSANKYYLPELQKMYPYDPEKAKQLLAEAGWDPNTEVVILTPTGNIVREQSADIIMANLQDVGIKAKVEKVDFPTRQARAQAGDFQLSLVGFSATFDPDFSGQVATGAGFNYSGYSSPKMDELLTTGKTTADFEAKKAVYTEAQQLFAEDLPFIPLYAPKALTVVNKRAKNVVLGPQGLTWNAHEWDVNQ